MTDQDRWDRVKELLQRSLELEEAAQSEFLEQACDGNEDLLQEVQSLLRHEVAAEDEKFLSATGRPHHDLSGSENGAVPARGRGLHVRCPNCHRALELVVDALLSDLTCDVCGSHFSLVDSQAETHSGVTTVAQFELIERLGMGGFGTVWKARDTQLERIVAIKIPRKGQLSASEIEKFLREARAVAQLRHPNIVSVHEVGRHDDIVFIVSDFVRGVTLAEWLADRSPSQTEAARIGMTIAKALHHAHLAGVVHRDLKPQNIMMDAEDEAHLMDFGLARRDAGEITVTMDGQILGTPAYMSPEQARGHGHIADCRSDVYSLGVILFELLTGERPFRGSLRMLMHQVLNEDAPSPRRLNSSIPKDLSTITLKCLEKDPAKRYQSAAEVSSELQAFLAGHAIKARPIGRLERTLRWCRRNPIPSAAALLLFVATIVSSTMAAWALSERAIADSEREKVESAERDARNLSDQVSETNVVLQNTLSDTQARLGFSAIESGNFAEGGLLFASAAATAESSDQDRWLANVVRASERAYFSARPIRAVMVEDTHLFDVQLLQDGKHMLTTEAKDSRLQYRVWNLETESELWSPLKLAAVGYQGDFLLIVRQDEPNTVLVYDGRTFEEIHRIDCKRKVTAVACSREDSSFAVASDEVAVYRGGRQPQRIAGTPTVAISATTAMFPIIGLDIHGAYVVATMASSRASALRFIPDVD